MNGDSKLVSIKDIPQKSVLKNFDCEVDALNEFLSKYALRNNQLGIGKTFVALNQQDKIVGYFTLATAQGAYQEIPDNYRGKLPKYPILALRIARLAVDKELKGKDFSANCKEVLDATRRVFMKTQLH